MKILLNKSIVLKVLRSLKIPKSDDADETMTAKLISDYGYVIKGIMNRLNS